jgi:4-diphosphocytidyl-2-C-methyl-D-erythritol kinase
MDRVRVEAYAKVNLGLAIVGQRPDGYHDIETIFQSVDLFDTVLLEPRSSDDISLRVRTARGPLPGSHGDADPGVPEGPENLAWKAARGMIATFGCPGVALTIEKRIPVAAGLGGGSADAAAVLAGMDVLFELGAGPDELSGLALNLGSDVPFMLTGGTAFGAGRGERLERLPPLTGLSMVLATPGFGVSARTAYAAARIGLTDEVSFIRVNCSAIREGDADRLMAGLRNDLEAGVVLACPEIADVRDALLFEGAAAAVMSGSGPTVIGLVFDRLHGERIASRLAGRGWTIHVVAPIDVGHRLIPEGQPGRD